MSLNAPDHSLDHESSSELMIGLSATLGFISTVVVILRMYTRLVQLRNAGLDDLMIVVTQVCFIFLPSALPSTRINLADYYLRFLRLG